MPDRDPWSAQFSSVGEFIRRQRNLANLSIRELADLSSVSNAYLSQIERGLHEPSVRVLTSVAKALNVSAETLLAQAGVIEGLISDDAPRAQAKAGAATEAAILADPGLSDAQKSALLSVYRSYLAEAGPTPTGRPEAPKPKPKPKASPKTNQEKEKP